MTDAAIISGVFVDMRTLPSRSVARITVEIPIEAANEALAKLGGFPLPSETRWVAVALLEPDAVGPVAAPVAAKPMPVEPVATAPSVTVGGKPWRDLKFAQQAGIMCQDADFIAWMRAADDKGAADAVRRQCGVASRADLDRDPDAAERWIRLSHDFFGRNDAASLERSLMQGRH